MASVQQVRNGVKLPSSVRIGPQVFTIEERAIKDDGMLNDGACGYTLDLGNIIVIDVNMAPSKKKQTMLHEIMHACKMVFGSTATPKKVDSVDEWEHYFIALWESTLLLVLKDNPKLTEWILSD